MNCAICGVELTKDNMVMISSEEGAIAFGPGMALIKGKIKPLCEKHYFEWTNFCAVSFEDFVVKNSRV